MLKTLNNSQNNSMITNKRQSDSKEETKITKASQNFEAKQISVLQKSNTPKKELNKSTENIAKPEQKQIPENKPQLAPNLNETGKQPSKAETKEEKKEPKDEPKPIEKLEKNKEEIKEIKTPDKHPKEVADLIKSEDSYRNSIQVETNQESFLVKPQVKEEKESVEQESQSHVPRQAANSSIQSKTIHTHQSKDKIKIFQDEDDSDIEKHLIESRKKLKDQMDNEISEESNPPTPIKSSVKVVLKTTDESAAISEGALKDAKNYLIGVYDKNRTQALRQDPFDYSNDKDLVFEGQQKNDDNIDLNGSNEERPIDAEEETKIQEDKITTARLGNTSTNEGKDKINVLNSDSDSEGGDPRYRVGSRFSSYHNDLKESKKEEPQNPIEEQIIEANDKDQDEIEQSYSKPVSNGLFSKEQQVADQANEVKRHSIIETMENEEMEETQGKKKLQIEEKINFNTIDNDDDLQKPLSPKHFEDDAAEEVKIFSKKATEKEGKIKEEVKDYFEYEGSVKDRQSPFDEFKMDNNPTNEILDSSINDGYADRYLNNRNDSSIEQTNEMASNYIKGLLKM